MKILHLMLACFYVDNYSYQENYLPKYHKLAGHNVEIVASLFTFDENGKGKWLTKRDNYMNEYGIPVTRLEFLKMPLSRRIRRYKGLMEELIRISPDIIFIHGVQFADVSVVVKFLKNHPKTQVFIDNHSDFSNSAQSWISKNILHKIVWKYFAQMISPYVKRFYGVLPARVDFLLDMYGLPQEKTELLIMGCDDYAAKAVLDPHVRKEIRKKYNINDDDFLIITGGKIDNYKKQTLLLMDAINDIDNPKLKLIVFGTVIPELKTEITNRCTNRVIYIGWINAEDSYKYFAASNLACFPGRHSVFWEQVAGQGIPLLVKKWNGSTHVDIGGNAKFLEKDTIEEIKKSLKEILRDDNYDRMYQSARKASKYFMYSNIAEYSIR